MECFLNIYFCIQVETSRLNLNVFGLHYSNEYINEYINEYQILNHL